MYMMGMGEKTLKYTQGENKGKNPPFSCPPIPPSTKKWWPTIFRCLKTPKTSRTYPR